MSFRERGAWISLATTLTIYGGYFGYVALRVAHGVTGGALLAPLVATVICLVVLQVVLTTVSSVITPGEAQAPADERERLIDLEAARAAFHVLQAGVFLAVSALLLWPSQPWLMANGVLMAMVVGEATRSALQVVGYRRMAA